jgi:ferritin-like protein
VANNLLAAVGGAPHLDRPPFPQQIGYVPEIQLALTPFDERTLERFLYLERPEGMDIRDVARDIDIGRPRLPQLTTPSFVPEPQDFDGIGGLYRELERGLSHLVDKYGEAAVFVGSARTQSCAQLFAFPNQVAELVPVTDLATAKRAMDTIVSEGEGAQGDWSTAHFGRFMAILREYRALKRDDPEFCPARPVAENPFTRLPRSLLRAPAWPPAATGSDAVVTSLIDDPDAARLCDLFDACYAVLLRMLERFFNHGEETVAELRIVADTAVDVMWGVIRPLGELLTTLPAGPSTPGQCAGPSFFVGGWTPVTTHKPAAWAVLSERLNELAEAAVNLEVVSPDLPTTIAGKLRAASVRLSPSSS